MKQEQNRENEENLGGWGAKKKEGKNWSQCRQELEYLCAYEVVGTIHPFPFCLLFHFIQSPLASHLPLPSHTRTHTRMILLCFGKKGGGVVDDIIVVFNALMPLHSLLLFIFAIFLYLFVFIPPRRPLPSLLFSVCLIFLFSYLSTDLRIFTEEVLCQKINWIIGACLADLEQTLC